MMTRYTTSARKRARLAAGVPAAGDGAGAKGPVRPPVWLAVCGVVGSARGVASAGDTPMAPRLRACGAA
jgi:hypothetical protein